ncbi:hypothetical protein BOX15_Mlig004794g8 [Macrostomum lignano]|uniref:DNA-directed DNA polymerase n=1 Tax=Macrostomum lignano TaxID=282301 RepID=A0A267H0H8_9PLAT|nr:hypothetical protein BOX15_Mlig004794g8 [Macrostomum lignano]
MTPLALMIGGCEGIIEKMNTNGSGWVIVRVNCIDLNIAVGQRLRFYSGHASNFELPPLLKAKKAVINPPSTGSDCFLYACLAVLHHGDENLRKNPQRLSTYKDWLNDINLSGISLPVGLNQLNRIELLNPRLCFVVFSWSSSNGVSVLRQPRVEVACSRKVVLLLLLNKSANKDEEDKHWCGIVSLDRLLNSKSGLYHRKWCERCLSSFVTDQKLSEHRDQCYRSNEFAVKERVPTEKRSVLSFQNYFKTIEAPFAIYADIEAFNSPLGPHTREVMHQKVEEMEVSDNEQVCSTRSSSSSSHVQARPDEGMVTGKTVFISEHLPAAGGFLLVAREGMKGPPLKDQGHVKLDSSSNPLECMETFLHELERVAREVYDWNRRHSYQTAEADTTASQIFSESSNCHYCDRQFTDTNDKHYDHDHLTGKFKGAACSRCNKLAQLRRRFLPIFFHNLRNYDMHLLFSTALGNMKNWKLSVIPQTSERYMSLRIDFPIAEITLPKGKKKTIFFTLQFLDSFQFLNAGLDKLIRNLPLQDRKFTQQMKSCFPKLTNETLSIKGVFPYDFVKSPANLAVTELPSREEFFNSLTKTACSEESYAHARKAWKQIEAKKFARLHACLPAA